MIEFQTLSGVLAGLLSIVASILYIIGIFRKDEKERIKPNRATWFIWAIVGWIILLSYRASGAEETIWVPVGYALGSTVIFLLSIKYGVGGWSRLDRRCLLAAGLSLVLWVALGATVALVAALLIDLAGFVPTLEKSWSSPQTEGRLAWGTGAIANLFNILAVKEWGFAVAIHPAYMFLAHILIVILLFRKTSKPASA